MLSRNTLYKFHLKYPYPNKMFDTIFSSLSLSLFRSLSLSLNFQTILDEYFFSTFKPYS